MVIAGRHQRWVLSRHCLGSQAGIAVAVIIILSTLLQACGAQDMPFSVPLKNNTNHVVTVLVCNDKCQTYDARTHLLPGHTLSTAQYPDGILRPIKIVSPSNAAGCLPFRFTQSPPSSIVIYVSQAVSCDELGREKLDSGQSWP